MLAHRTHASRYSCSLDRSHDLVQKRGIVTLGRLVVNDGLDTPDLDRDKWYVQTLICCELFDQCSNWTNKQKGRCKCVKENTVKYVNIKFQNATEN